MLILFDLLLVVVLALLLYAISARDPIAEPGIFDWVQLVLVVCALGVDVFALANIATRLAEYGFSANKTAALGLNLILLVEPVVVGVAAGAVHPFEGRVRPGRALADALPARVCRVGSGGVVAFPPLFGFA